MNVQLKALILDVGGVLILGHQSAGRTKWADRLGVSLKELDSVMWNRPEAARLSRGGMTFDEYWRLLGQELGLTEAESLAMRGDYFSGDSVNDAAVALARQAREAGFKVGILSNAFGSLDQLLESIGIRTLFDDVVDSWCVGMAKPEQQIYELACRRLGVVPEEVLFVDDRTENVEAAAALGMVALCYQSETTLEAARNALGLAPGRSRDESSDPIGTAEVA